MLERLNVHRSAGVDVGQYRCATPTHHESFLKFPRELCLRGSPAARSVGVVNSRR
jgi:hypothetical protein